MDYIRIAGYKSIKDIALKLQPINILIGANGSGKSNFISFFEFLNHLYNRKLKEYISLGVGEEKLLHKGSKETMDISFETSFDQGNNGYAATIRLGGDGFKFVDEHLIYQGDYGYNISNLEAEARLKITDNFRAKYIIKYLEGYRKYHFHDTSKNSPFTRVSNLNNDIYYLYEDGWNLAAFLYNINQNHKIIYNRIIHTIQSIAPYFSDFYFQPNPDENIRLLWQDKYSSTIYSANNLSDGTMRFIALTVLFMQPELPATIIIDEPELGLHPFAVTKLAGMIKSAASRTSQVIVATQSADLVNHFEANDIITVDQTNGESQFKRLVKEDLSQWLEEYSIGDLWQLNIIQGGQPKWNVNHESSQKTHRSGHADQENIQ